MMKKVLTLIILLLMAYIFRGEILTAYARLFTVNNATDGADAMIIMSGNIDTRPAYAAELYHKGYAKRVFLTHEKNWLGDLSPYVEARNLYAHHALLKAEIPVEFLPGRHPEGAMSTLDEVYDVVDFLKQNEKILHIILVTDTPHSYRTHYIFNRIFKENGLGHIQLEVAAAPNDIFNEENWYQTEKGVVFYIEESIKVPFYWLNLADKNLVVPR